jgi:uncharacterized protein (TIGR02147 family)
MDANSELLRANLEREFNTRKKVNSRYSVRAFGAYLGVDASTLSKVIAGSRAPSQNFIETVAKKLNIPLKGSAVIQEQEMIYISALEFQAISSWEYFAMLDLVLLQDFQYDYVWMSSKLGIKEVDARIVVQKLLGLGLLREENNKLIKTAKSFSNHSDQTTNAVKKEYQRQLLKKALSAIDTCESDKKDITSITIAADPKRLDIAREKIKHFRRELCAFLEGGDQTEVLHLTIQLCPAKTAQQEVS